MSDDVRRALQRIQRAGRDRRAAPGLGARPRVVRRPRAGLVAAPEPPAAPRRGAGAPRPAGRVPLAARPGARRERARRGRAQRAQFEAEARAHGPAGGRLAPRQLEPGPVDRPSLRVYVTARAVLGGSVVGRCPARRSHAGSSALGAHTGRDGQVDAVPLEAAARRQVVARAAGPSAAGSPIRTAGQLRVVAGDGTDDAPLRNVVGAVAPAWRPGVSWDSLPSRRSDGRIELVDVDSTKITWAERASGRPAVPRIPGPTTVSASSRSARPR